MNEFIILRTFLTAFTPKIHKIHKIHKVHKVGRASLTSCVSSLLNGTKASVTRMGRVVLSSAYVKIASNEPTGCCLINVL
jgi:hypothetical protein